MSLRKWVKERWVDIGAPKKNGKYQPCGRKKGDGRAYPKCVPISKARSMTSAQKRSAVKRKRSKAQGVGGISFQHASSGVNIQQNSDSTSGGYEFYVFRRNSTQIGSINQSSTNAVTYNTSSDARLKDITGSSRGLERI